MAKKGYSSVNLVEAAYGQALTGDQAIYLDSVLEAAEAVIDGLTDSAWLTGPVTGERHRVLQDLVFLRSAPVASVQAVYGWPEWSSTAVGALVSASTYALVKPASGWLYISWWPTCYAFVTVNYTPAATVPALIREATTRLALAWLQGAEASSALAGGIKRLSVGSGDLVIEQDTATDSAALAVPTEVLALLGPYRDAVVVA